MFSDTVFRLCFRLKSCFAAAKCREVMEHTINEMAHITTVSEQKNYHVLVHSSTHAENVDDFGGNFLNGIIGRIEIFNLVFAK